MGQKENMKKYRESHKEIIAARNKIYREANREKRLAYEKAYREANREQIRERQKTRYENNRELFIARSKASREKYIEVRLAREKLRRDNNRERHSAYGKAYRESNKERLLEKERLRRKNNKFTISESNKRWSHANSDKVNLNVQRYRARKKQLPSTLTLDQWESIKEAFYNKCCYCGEAKLLTQEHFIPASQSGEYTHNNIIPACGSCNSSKQGRDFVDWYPRQSFYSKARENKILKYLNYSRKHTQQLALF